MSELETAAAQRTYVTIFDYLGMTLDFSQEGKVAVRMDEYVQDILDEARDNMAREAVTPAADYLFEVNEDA